MIQNCKVLEVGSPLKFEENIEIILNEDLEDQDLEKLLEMNPTESNEANMYYSSKEQISPGR